MALEIDVRGLACPQPVITTKKQLDSNAAGEFIVIVDNEAAKDNVLKLAQSYAYSATVENLNNDFQITITKTGTEQNKTPKPSTPDRTSTAMAVMITNRNFGQGSEELGAVLMKSFMYTLVEGSTNPSVIILANSGAYLSCQGSPVLEHLQTLAKRGVEILTCGTCLDYYHLKDQLAVGEVSNMYTIKENLDKAGKILNI